MATGSEGPKDDIDQADLDSDAAQNKLGPTRPSGCPTNFEMVDMILSSAEKEGKDGLPIAEIIAEMLSRYWPGLKDVQVSAPICMGLARRGRFKKTGSGQVSNALNETRKRVKPQNLEATENE